MKNKSINEKKTSDDRNNCVKEDVNNQILSPKTLDISSGCLYSLNGLCDYECLKTLIAYDNYINNIEYLEKFPDLEILHLQFNSIKSLENVFGNSCNLEEIRLDNNIISYIRPSDFLNCQCLTFLNVGFNKLRNIEFVQSIRTLKELYVDHNQLKCIDAINECKQLTDFDASSNEISQVCDALRGLHKLQNLNLSQNMIGSVYGLENMNKIISVDISANTIDSIACIATACPNIEYLDARKNAICNAEEIMQAMEYLKSLQFLCIEENPIDFSNSSITENSLNAAIVQRLGDLEKTRVGLKKTTTENKKTLTMRDTGREVLEVIENQFSSLNAIGDIYNAKIVGCHDRLIKTLNSIASSYNWTDDIELEDLGSEDSQKTRKSNEDTRSGTDDVWNDELSDDYVESLPSMKARATLLHETLKKLLHDDLQITEYEDFGEQLDKQTLVHTEASPGQTD